MRAEPQTTSNSAALPATTDAVHQRTVANDHKLIDSREGVGIPQGTKRAGPIDESNFGPVTPIMSGDGELPIGFLIMGSAFFDVNLLRFVGILSAILNNGARSAMHDVIANRSQQGESICALPSISPIK